MARVRRSLWHFSIIGNQQSRPEAALVEKIVNSVDARLMNQCLVQGIDPTSSAAPCSIRHAVAQFFEDKEIVAQSGGTIRDWARTKRTEESHNITLAATGPKAKSLFNDYRYRGRTNANSSTRYFSVY